MFKIHDWCESYETPFLFRVNMPKLFCSFRVRLKIAFYGTSKFVLTLYFCEPLLIIVQENRSIRNIKKYHSIFDKIKRKAINRMLLRYSWKLFVKILITVVAGTQQWKVFQKQTFHLTSTIYLLLRCSTEKQTTI